MGKNRRTGAGRDKAIMAEWEFRRRAGTRNIVAGELYRVCHGKGGRIKIRQ